MSKGTKLKFKLTDKTIDYFELKPEYFSPYASKFEKIQIDLDNESFLSKEHFPDTETQEPETIVMNFQVGKGKTTVLYNLIEQYYRQGFYIIICSPFLKLVNKDFDFPYQKLVKEVRSEGIRFQKAIIFNYLKITEDYDSEGFTDGYRSAPYVYKIHVMTVNCFLGNPGEDALEQNFFKKDYLNHLSLATDDEKVILLFDELHESLHNFKPEFIVNLMKWKGKIHKIYISSATFNPSTIPIINLLSMLTGRNVKVYEAKRIKNKIQGDISLHLFPKKLNKWNYPFLNFIDREVDFHRKAGKMINVICATKSIAEFLAERWFQSNVVRDESVVISESEGNFINLLTAETNVTYKRNQNNIGTNFKTGVDIDDPNNSLFIIFPSLLPGDFKTFYGIFTDGIPAILQAVGRARKGSKIHLIMTESNYFINSDNGFNNDDLKDKTLVEHFTLNQEFDKAKQKYDDILESDAKYINLMEADTTNSNSEHSLEIKKQKFGFWYQNFHEFLLKDRRSHFVHEEPAYGKHISPYVLWACLNEQFTNASLKELISYKSKMEVRDINAHDAVQVFLDLLETNRESIRNKTFREISDHLDKYIGKGKDNDGDVIELQFRISESDRNSQVLNVTRILNKKPDVCKKAFIAVLTFVSSSKVLLEKSMYINSCIKEASASDSQGTKLKDLYVQLGVIKAEFLEIVKKETIEISESYYIKTTFHQTLDTNFIKKAVDVVSQIRKVDIIIKTNAISFLQNIDDAQGVARSISKEFLDTFQNFQKKFADRKMVNGKNYYLLPAEFMNFPDPQAGYYKVQLL